MNIREPIESDISCKTCNDLLVCHRTCAIVVWRVAALHAKPCLWRQAVACQIQLPIPCESLVATESRWRAAGPYWLTKVPVNSIGWRLDLDLPRCPTPFRQQMKCKGSIQVCMQDVSIRCQKCQVRTEDVAVSPPGFLFESLIKPFNWPFGLALSTGTESWKSDRFERRE